MSQAFTESVVEEAALAWLESLGYVVKHGPHIALREIADECAGFSQVALDKRRRDALPPKFISGKLRVRDAEKLLERKYVQ